MKKITLLFCALSISISSIAQISVSGTVSNDSIPLEFANVIIKNSTKGVATNFKGEFKVEAKKGDTLSISYLGYEVKEIVVGNSNRLDIILAEGGRLNEVVINAFLGNVKTRCGVVCYKTGCGVYCRGVIIEEGNEKSIDSKLYPNPSSHGVFQLKLNEDYDDVKISVANISGHIIQNSTHQNFGENVTIDLSQFSTGIYIVTIVADGKQLESIKAIRS